MLRKIVSVIMLTLLLIGMLTLTFNIKLVQADSEPVRLYENQINHIGDLIINGNQSFIIENCSYTQTGNIYVKENGTLVIKNAELVMNMSGSWQYNIYIYDTGRLIIENSDVSTPTIFDINFFDKSSGNLANSTIGGRWGRLGYVCLEIMSQSLSDIFIKNCSVYYVRTYSDSSTITVTNSSDVTCFSIEWARCNLSISNLRSGYITYWNSYKNASVVGQCSNVTIFNSTVRWAEMFFDRSNASVTNSDINSVWCLTDSNVTIGNITSAWIHTVDASKVKVYNITRHQYLAPWGGKTKISLFNVRLYRLWTENFQGTIFSENVVFETVLFRDSQFYTWGNFSGVWGAHEWTNSNVTRNFNVIVTDEMSCPLADAKLKLYDQNSNLVWSGISNVYGRTNFNLTFSDSNYTDTLRLEAVKETLFSAKNVTFLSDTPITMVLLSPPHGPKAEFTATPETTIVGEPVRFDASGSLPGFNGTHEMPITEYQWDFGDGNKTTSSNPIIYNSFSSSGIYYVTLTVYAPGATPETDSTIHKVTVISVPVGGYSLPIKGYITTKPLTPYLAIVAILTAVFTIIKRKTHRRTKRSPY